MYINLQRDLAALYAMQHNGQELCNDGKAVLFPSIVTNSIQWHTCATPAQLTAHTRTTIVLSNTMRPPGERKDPLLYTTHSMKVGGAIECCMRHYNLHECQQFTGHISPRNFALYAQLMEKFDAGHTIVDMQTPQLSARFNFKSSRQLQELLLEAAEALVGLRTHLDSAASASDTLKTIVKDLQASACRMMADFKAEHKAHQQCQCYLLAYPIVSSSIQEYPRA